MLNFSDLISRTLRGSTFRIKKTIYVKRRIGREETGRFNGKNRIAYSYPIYDFNQPVKRMTLLEENITASNELFRRLKTLDTQ